MSVLLETTEGNLVVDLFVEDAPNESFNFIKLCKAKHFNLSLFSKVEKNFIATCQCNRNTSIMSYRTQESIQVVKYMKKSPGNTLSNNDLGILSFIVTNNEGDVQFGSDFTVTLTPDESTLNSLNKQTIPFGKVAEGFTVLEQLNSCILDDSTRPLKDIRILHTYILDDPFEDDTSIQYPPKSPKPSQAQIDSFRLLLDSEDDFSLEEGSINDNDEEKILKESKARSQALTLELLGDLPTSTIQPSEKVLFICKLNPITTEDDLKLIFGRFGDIESCEILHDKATGKSLCYGFIEYPDKKCVEEAYSKMDNVLIDDRRIHVDFSQSVKRVGQYLNDYERKSGKRARYGSSDYKRDTSNARHDRKHDKYRDSEIGESENRSSEVKDDRYRSSVRRHEHDKRRHSDRREDKYRDKDERRDTSSYSSSRSSHHRSSHHHHHHHSRRSHHHDRSSKDSDSHSHTRSPTNK